MELYNMGNSETICLLKYSDIKMMLLVNEGMEREIGQKKTVIQH